MTTSVLERFGQVRVGAAATHAGVTVFPLFGSQQGSATYVILANARAAGAVDVAELEQASVGMLVAINRGMLPVLILDGEELVGGRQNRIVNSSVLLPSGRTALPMSCVEHGRWHERGAAFSSSESSHPSLRRAKAAQVSDALRTRGAHEADQGQIWTDIAVRHNRERITSTTGALADLRDQRRDQLVACEAALPYPVGAIGMIVAIGGGIVSLDLFDAPETARVFWPQLVRAAALDGLAVPAGTPIALSRAIRMLRRVRKTRLTPFHFPGLGVDMRVAGNGVIGSVLVYEGVVVHAALFRQHRYGPAPLSAHYSVLQGYVAMP